MEIGFVHKILRHKISNLINIVAMPILEKYLNKINY